VLDAIAHALEAATRRIDNVAPEQSLSLLTHGRMRVIDHLA
jgi:hypothetical protein